MTDMLAKRFEPYFRHPDWGHDLLGPGDRAIACYNIRRALSWLHIDSGTSSLEEDIYDDELKDAVRTFQIQYNHRVADGLVGPGTRQRLVSELLHRFEPSIFNRLRRPEGRQQPSVFLSYAWADGPKVDKLDQWLRDHGVSVVRDRDFFVAGVTVEENIAQALSVADKIVAVFSVNSRDRDWPHLERSLAEHVEARLGSSMLIYLRLDDAPLPSYDSTRIAITAEGHSLKEVGEQLLHAIAGGPLVPPHYHYDEDQPL
jgi:TIR domain/Putative peptidoglycan binding domain